MEVETCGESRKVVKKRFDFHIYTCYLPQFSE